MVEGIMNVIDGEHFINFNKWANKSIKESDIGNRVEYILNHPSVKFPARYKEHVELEISRELSNGPMTVWGLYNAFHSVIEHHLVREKGKYNRARALDENIYKFFATDKIFGN